MKKSNVLALAALVSITIAVVFAGLIAASPIATDGLGGESQQLPAMSIPF